MTDITLTGAELVDMDVSQGGTPGEIWVALLGRDGVDNVIVRIPGDMAKALYQKFGATLSLLALTNPSGTIQSAVGADHGMVTLELWEIMKPERCVGICLYPVRARELGSLLAKAADHADRSGDRLRVVKTEETP